MTGIVSPSVIPDDARRLSELPGRVGVERLPLPNERTETAISEIEQGSDGGALRQTSSAPNHFRPAGPLRKANLSGMSALKPSRAPEL